MKKLRRYLLEIILPPIVFVIVRILYISCKKKFDVDFKLEDKPVVIVFWHGKLLMQPFLYKFVRYEKKVATMISDHHDGNVLANTMKLFGFVSIRGSSTRGGAKALIGAIKKMRNGYDIALTPDGPKGPLKSVAIGVIKLAQKVDANVVAWDYKSSSYWKLKSWDGFIIPKPFSTITFTSSNPFSLKELNDEESIALLTKKLDIYEW